MSNLFTDSFSEIKKLIGACMLFMLFECLKIGVGNKDVTETSR